MKIAVLAGGLSPEREVSLSSGSLIANALCACGHKVALADVYLGTGGKRRVRLFCHHSYRQPSQKRADD